VGGKNLRNMQTVPNINRMIKLQRKNMYSSDDSDQAMGWRTRESFQNFQTDFGANPASYSVGTGVPFPRVKRPRSEAYHSAPHSAEVKNGWSYTSAPVCLHDLHRENFTFYIKDKWNWTSAMHGGSEKCTQLPNWKTWRENASWET
jgi:hypothetical protein